VIGRLRKALASAFGLAETQHSAERQSEQTEAGRRIEAARKRLRETIPPRED